ncbi:MAG: DUF2868 domain-containing protein [Comamonas sp.]
MRPDAVRDIVLAYAIETAPPSPALPTPERCQALTADTLHALGSEPLPPGDAPTTASPRFQAFVQQRAARIIQASELPADVRQVWQQSARLAPWIPLAIVAGALLVGFAGHRIADPHRVNLLSLPLLALVAWNLLMYAWLLLHGAWAWLRRAPQAAAPLVPTAQAEAAAPASASAAPPWWQRLSGKRWQPLRGNPLRKMALAFEKNWWNLARNARHAQWLQWLHLGAAMLALGALASLWTTGLTNAYQVGWESTFLSAEQVQRLLNALFWPAQALLHASPWSLADIQALQGWVANPAVPPVPNRMFTPPSIGAQWVVAYSTLLAAVVIVPRTLLALWQWARARWLRNRLPLPWRQAYFQDLLRDFGGLATTLRITPYNLAPSPERQQVLQAWVAQQHGAGAQLQWQNTVRYGDPLPPAAGQAVADGAQPVLLLSLAATPEAEVHGVLLAEARERWGSGAQVWLWAQDFAERNRATPRRLQEREQLWREFVRPYGLAATILPCATA